MSKNCKTIIKLNHQKINKLDNAAIKSLEQTAEATKTDLINSGKMPFDSGNLQNESTFIDISKSKNGEVSIISSTPYARRLYFHPEYNFQTVNNSNAGGRWFDDYINGDKNDFIKDAFKKLYKKNGGV